MTPAPLGWYYTKADIFFLYKVQLYLTHFLFCFCGPDTLTGDKLNVDKYLFWISWWLTLQVVYFIPELIWIIEFFSYYKFKQAFFIFHDKHYELYFSYQRWYESLMYPLWIITRGHFCRFCVNDNTYTVSTPEPVTHLKPLSPRVYTGTS